MKKLVTLLAAACLVTSFSGVAAAEKASYSTVAPDALENRWFESFEFSEPYITLGTVTFAEYQDIVALTVNLSSGPYLQVALMPSFGELSHSYYTTTPGYTNSTFHNVSPGTYYVGVWGNDLAVSPYEPRFLQEIYVPPVPKTSGSVKFAW